MRSTSSHPEPSVHTRFGVGGSDGGAFASSESRRLTNHFQFGSRAKGTRQAASSFTVTNDVHPYSVRCRFRISRSNATPLESPGSDTQCVTYTSPRVWPASTTMRMVGPGPPNPKSWVIRISRSIAESLGAMSGNGHGKTSSARCSGWQSDDHRHHERNSLTVSTRGRVRRIPFRATRTEPLRGCAPLAGGIQNSGALAVGKCQCDLLEARSADRRAA